MDGLDRSFLNHDRAPTLAQKELLPKSFITGTMADQTQPLSAKADPVTEDPAASSDKETETFEDAVDGGSVRSLTARKSVSAKPSRPISGDASSVADTPSSPVEDQVLENDHSNADESSMKEVEEDGSRRQSVAKSNRMSNASLDNVNLDDEVVEQQKKDQPEPVVEKRPSKKLSLSNIASSLASMPWSPSTSESPSKGSPNASQPEKFSSTSPVPTPAPAPAPSSTSRKFTAPFSWLSRNSMQKEKDSVTSPPATSPRRNTASSIATLTSNPEMMLSKLDEGDEGEGRNGRRNSVKNSLRDRFKMVRMREEAGIIIPEIAGEDNEGLGVRSATLGVMSPAADVGQEMPNSPIPPSPNPSLAPGTVSGVQAGPSAMTDSQVDWDLWQSLVDEGPSAVARTSPEELNRAIATGIPNVIRGLVWQVLAQSKNDELEAVYRELAVRGTEKDKDRNSNGTSVSTSSLSNGNLSIDKEVVASSASSVHSDVSGVKSPPLLPEKDSEALLKVQASSVADRKKKEKEDAAKLQKLEKVIRRDMGARTSFSKHAAAAGLQDGLFGVCKAYALFDEGVGYAQGMNFLIMPLLFNMPEEEAFCLLVRLMNQYKLRDLFIQDMPGLHLHLYQFERLLEDLEPAVYCHLHRRGISGHLYATQWFLTLFAYRFPLQLVLRIYDLILSEGLSAIIKFGIVLMQKNSQALLGMSDMAQLTTFLKDKLFDVYIDPSPSAGSILENGFFGSSSSNIDKEVYRADEFVRDACEVKVTPEMLKQYTAEWEEKTRLEKEREQELEALKKSNLSNAIKVRKLEERIEACDREQATLANDMVYAKIENETLKDENESLKGQVKELRNVIEKQPLEIEEKWKLERDNLIERNTKVHEENQKLEQELSELEEELVQTKMRYAEINSQHETLQRKWTELKRQFA